MHIRQAEADAPFVAKPDGEMTDPDRVLW
jgi:hypothetical protein